MGDDLAEKANRLEKLRDELRSDREEYVDEITESLTKLRALSGKSTKGVRKAIRRPRKRS